ncbi:uncharacterized protein EDB91DRAFT_1082757 [Suillus paluster]|uniref:uncharacterized protein n=1 Tax=Suillus paluster TaxID=48578 RepID=UPI001B87D30B|nr:uncharacterized protein EDB91DRAFT_1082757 [Suillus paluster]KAG1738362.1 hypothetical protein EDB91DRAFT_1082757 [Suillus paluster]
MRTARDIQTFNWMSFSSSKIQANVEPFIESSTSISDQGAHFRLKRRRVDWMSISQENQTKSRYTELLPKCNRLLPNMRNPATRIQEIWTFLSSLITNERVAVKRGVSNLNGILLIRSLPTQNQPSLKTLYQSRRPPTINIVRLYDARSHLQLILDNARAAGVSASFFFDLKSRTRKDEFARTKAAGGSRYAVRGIKRPGVQNRAARDIQLEEVSKKLWKGKSGSLTEKRYLCYLPESRSVDHFQSDSLSDDVDELLAVLKQPQDDVGTRDGSSGMLLIEFELAVGNSEHEGVRQLCGVWPARPQSNHIQETED